jgi:hypothetical protein
MMKSIATNTVKWMAALTVAACPLLACGGAPQEGDAASGATEEGITNGTLFSAAQVGFVELASSTTCTGTLVRNDWVLTAASCNAQPGTVARRGTETTVVDRVINDPDVSYGVNVALLHLSTALPVNGVSQGFVRNIRPTLLNVGQAVRCFGYGRISPSGPTGTLHYAVLTVASAANNLYRFYANASGQSFSYGDLGATCLDDQGAATVVIGTIAEFASPPYGEGVTSQLTEPWIDGVLNGSWYHDPIPGVPPAASDTYSFASQDTLVTVYRSTSNHVIMRRRQGATQTWEDLTAATGLSTVPAGKPVAIRNTLGIGDEDVIFRGANNHIYMIYREAIGTSIGYGINDVHPSDAPLAVGDPTSTVFSDGTVNVYYRGVDAHIHNLRWGSSGVVTHTDVSARVGAQAAGGDPVSYDFGSTEQHAIYRGTNNSLYELQWTQGNWYYRNLTSSANAPAATGEIWAYSSSSEEGVIFRTSDNAVWALWWRGGIGWTAQSLTQATGAPLAGGDPIGFFNPVEGTHHIIYRSADNHIQEIWGGPSTSFGHGDLTNASGAPTYPYAVGVPSGTAVPARASTHVVYRDFTGALHELHWPRN